MKSSLIYTVPASVVAFLWRESGKLPRPLKIASRGVLVSAAAYAAFNVGWVTVRPVYQWTTASYQEVHVEEKWIKQNPTTKQDQYLADVKFKDGTTAVIVCEDSWIWWTFNASDRWARLKKGQTATVKLAGIRFPYLSWYENAVRVH